MPPEPEITRPPRRVRADATLLATAFDKLATPKRAGRNRTIGTWSLRAFCDLTKRWDSWPDDSPTRIAQLPRWRPLGREP